MNLVETDGKQSTIRFSAKLFMREDGVGSDRPAFLSLPQEASARLPTDRSVIVEAVINGFPLRTSLERHGKATHRLTLSRAMQDAVRANIGATVEVEITRIADEPELRVPADLRQALGSAPRAAEMWAATTPMAQRDWILWIISGREAETRNIRIEKACSMLASGKKRVCCFGGVNWLTKDHRGVETWVPLPKSSRTRPAGLHV